MTAKRLLAIVIACFIILVVTIILYYRTVQTPTWNDETIAKEKAIEAAELASVTDVTKHVWDSESWIVEGVDQAGEDVFVWITTTGTEEAKTEHEQTVKASEGSRKADVKAAFHAMRPDSKLKRIQPGMLNGELVWEVFYTMDEGSTKYFYDFYRFKDGSFITQYRLTAKTAG